MTRYVTPVALSLVLTACGGAATGDSTTTVAPGTTIVEPTSTTTVATTSTTTAPTTTVTAPPMVGTPQTDAYQSDAFPGAGDTAFLTTVRTETYDTFTRIVFEFDGATPEFRIEYLDGEPLASPSGNPLDIEGNAFLSVIMAPAAGVDLSGDEPVVTYEGPDRISIDANAITQLVKSEDFEATLGWVVGLDSERPFSFTTLGDPHRLVIDIEVDTS